MKNEREIFRTIITVVALAFGIQIVNATEPSSIQWNGNAQSAILSDNKLVKLGGAFSDWKVKQMIWPSVSEISSKMIAVDPNLKAECHRWISKIIKEDQLPANLEQHLIPMKEWGVIRKEAEQKRLCDVFITQFKKGDYVVHIQESPYNLVVTVADERLANVAQAGHKDLVVEISNIMLNEVLRPILASENFHVFEFTSNEQKITRVSWAIESTKVIGKDGKKSIDPHKAGEIGTTYIEAETDGKFVKFEVIKCPGAVKNAYFDPYVERFSTKQK